MQCNRRDSKKAVIIKLTHSKILTHTYIPTKTEKGSGTIQLGSYMWLCSSELAGICVARGRKLRISPTYLKCVRVHCICIDNLIYVVLQIVFGRVLAFSNLGYAWSTRFGLGQFWKDSGCLLILEEIMFFFIRYT